MTLEKNLGLLSALGAQLNEGTEELNEAIAIIERRINETKAGVSVWLDHFLNESDQDDEGLTTAYQLGYAKLRDGWHLAARHVTIKHEGGDAGTWEIVETSEPTPLATAPRGVRVGAADLFEDLVEALADRVKGFLASIERAKAVARG